MISGGHIEPAFGIQREVPDVLGLGIEINSAGIGLINRRALGAGLGLLLSTQCGHGRLLRLGGLLVVGASLLLAAGTASRDRLLLLDAVHLAVRRSRSVERAMRIRNQRLHLQFLRLKDDAGAAFRRDAVNARRRTGCRINIPLSIGGDAPDVRGGRGDELLE